MEPDENAQIVLVRHGETEWSRDGRHTSVTDVALTATGRQQAKQVGQALAGRRFAVVLTSPRQRAWTTAELAGFSTYRVDPNLVEWNYGPFEGRTTAQIAAELGHPWTIWAGGAADEPLPGESAAEVGARADAVLGSLEPQLSRGEAVLVFAHAHTLRILAARWLGLPADEGARFALGTGSISTLGFEHGGRVLQRWNLQP
ncbi:MAG: histidine phosphatase family protein [Microbacteriaceae bacterium]